MLSPNVSVKERLESPSWSKYNRNLVVDKILFEFVWSAINK